jgi:hypothetical protein
METPFTDGGGGEGDDDLDRVETWQRFNALTGELTAWPASIASQATIVRQVNGLAPISQGPLNEIKILPQGSFVRVPAPLARVSAAGSYGLPIISGAINQYEIHERQQAGQITSREANLETATNIGFTTASVGIGGYGLPAVAGAVETPAGALAFVGVCLAYDLTVAQGTVNNMIEGQEVGDAFWNARATTNDRFTFGHGQQLEATLDRAGAAFAEAIISIGKLFDN